SAKDLPDPNDASSIEEFTQLHFRSILRGQTKAVRNWGYEEQTVDFLKKLYEPLEDAIERESGFRVSLLIDAVRTQCFSIGQKLQEHFDKCKLFMQQRTITGAVESYLKAFKDPGITAEKIEGWVQNDGWKFENVQVMLFHRSTSF